MRFKTKWEKLLIATIGISIGILLIGTSSQATWQANAATHSTGKKDTGANWITSIRQMETAGQTMGLTETIGSNLVATSTSNNIDVHMMKSTEYGAMAILSASGFGNPKTLQDSTIKSTTGNVTGVYITGTRWEWTASTIYEANIGKDKRYYDLYVGENGKAKTGDALGSNTSINVGCTLEYGNQNNSYITGSSWHNSNYAGWINYSECAFMRGGNGIFSFNGMSNLNGKSFARWNDAYCSYVSRGVAVVGQGL